MVTLNQKSMGGQIGGQIGGQMGGQMDLTARQQEVLGFILANNSVSRAELAQLMDINESAVQKHLKNLKTKGIIERIGGTRGHWQVNSLE